MLRYLDGLRGNQRGLARVKAGEMMVQSEQDKDTGEGAKVILASMV